MWTETHSGCLARLVGFSLCLAACQAAFLYPAVLQESPFNQHGSVLPRHCWGGGALNMVQLPILKCGSGIWHLKKLPACCYSLPGLGRRESAPNSRVLTKRCHCACQKSLRVTGLQRLSSETSHKLKHQHQPLQACQREAGLEPVCHLRSTHVWGLPSIEGKPACFRRCC